METSPGLGTAAEDADEIAIHTLQRRADDPRSSNDGWRSAISPWTITDQARPGPLRALLASDTDNRRGLLLRVLSPSPLNSLTNPERTRSIKQSMANMAQPPWTVHTHIIPAAYPRAFRRGVRDPQTSRLKLHVNQYIPHSAPPSASSRPGATIIFAHGLGTPKETYEPFFADLLNHPSTPPIAAIWAADSTNHAASYTLNESDIGDEPSWLDGAHDTIQLINHFQSRMTVPLIGIGQSWGCVRIALPASWNPRIFQAIILLEPVIETGYYHLQELKEPGYTGQTRHIAFAVSGMRDSWPDRASAHKAISKLGYYAGADPRVLERAYRHELRDLPDGTVTLSTPKYQQAQLFIRAGPAMAGYPEGYDWATRTAESYASEGFYRGEPAKVKEYLRAVHCPVLYVWSTDESFVSNPKYRARVVGVTGTGVGGGGGKEKGQVHEVFVKAGGHALPFIEPGETARVVAGWLGGEMGPRWEREEEERRDEAPIDPVTVPREWMARIARIAKI
ncbi:hypothetical protein FQN51_000670 [Onygenales sp. PD_10]|nr:hypothetical protein FQN51_000670 [Onygenales sp. PD_10]